MTCAKNRVRVTLTHPDGRSWTGENRCRNPQAVCPRAPGEDYTKCRTVCDQVGHAEIDALALAGENARGSTASLEGHTYYCMDCQHALFAAGVLALLAPGVPVVDEAQERIAFEAWCESRGRGHSTVLKFDNGDYRNETAREEWRGWLGRATHSSGVAACETKQEKNMELPDAIRVPLDELEADAAYIIGRVAADGSCSAIMVEAIRHRTRAIREALLALGVPGKDEEAQQR